MFLLAALLLAAAPVGPAPGETRFDREIDAAMRATAGVYVVPRELVLAVMRQESGFRPDAVSPVGAVGLMQCMPYTAAKTGLSVEDLRDPAKNVLCGVRLLAVLLRHFQGDVISALVAYNAPARPLGAPVPVNGETPEYVKRVLTYYRYYLGVSGKKLPLQAPAVALEPVNESPFMTSRPRP